MEISIIDFFIGNQQKKNKKNGCFSSKKQKKKSPFPSTLSASHLARLSAPGCTSHFSTESFLGKKIYFLAQSHNVRLFGCVWILSKQFWATVQKKKKEKKKRPRSAAVIYRKTFLSSS